MSKIPNDAYALLEKMASNNYQWHKERNQPKKVAGVYEVQKVLGADLDARLSATVTRVEQMEDGQVKVHWKTPEQEVQEEIFDRVVLAVAPDVVGWIFQPLEHVMKRIPSTTVRNCVQAERMTLAGEVNNPSFHKSNGSRSAKWSVK